MAAKVVAAEDPQLSADRHTFPLSNKDLAQNASTGFMASELLKSSYVAVMLTMLCSIAVLQALRVYMPPALAIDLLPFVMKSSRLLVSSIRRTGYGRTHVVSPWASLSSRLGMIASENIFGL